MKFSCSPVFYLCYLAFAAALDLIAFIIFISHRNIISASGWLIAFITTLINAIALYHYIQFKEYAKNTNITHAPFLYTTHPTKADLNIWYAKQSTVIIIAAIASPIHLFCLYLLIDCINRHIQLHNGDPFNNQWTSVGAFLIASKSVDCLLIYVYRKYSAVYAAKHSSDSAYDRHIDDLSPLSFV